MTSMSRKAFLAQQKRGLTFEDLYTPPEMAPDDLSKHEGGGHDQKSHGNWARGWAKGMTLEAFAATGSFAPSSRPESMSYGEYKRNWRQSFEALPDNAEIVVFHATTREVAEAMARDGVTAAAKPTSLARQQYEAGEETFFQPGAGLGEGLYVGVEPQDIDGFGNSILAIKVPKGSLTLPPEAEGLPLGMAITSADGAVAVGDIPAENIINLYPSRRRYVTGSPYEELSGTSRAAQALREEDA